jgi:hypothetical protein
MNAGKTLFAQLMDFLPWSTFARIVARYAGDRRVRVCLSRARDGKNCGRTTEHRASVTGIKALLLKQMAESLGQQWAEERHYTRHVSEVRSRGGFSRVHPPAKAVLSAESGAHRAAFTSIALANPTRCDVEIPSAGAACGRDPG